MHYYDPPAVLTGTVFDPEDETFGPIMAALQSGDFEEAALLTASLTSDRFALTIGMGNDGMQTAADVLAAIARSVNYPQLGTMRAGDSEAIRDGNGNTVGAWIVT